MYAKRKVVVLSVLFAFIAIGTALAATGACGGGYSFNAIYSNWLKKGVLDDVNKIAGITPGVDAAKGKASKDLLRKSLTLRTVVRGDSSVSNTTCDRRYFRGVGRASQPRGTKVWVLKNDIGKNGVVKRWWPADCGNLRRGNIKVKVPRKKHTPAKPKPPKGQAPICTQTDTSNSLNCSTVIVKCGVVVIGNGNDVDSDNCNEAPPCQTNCTPPPPNDKPVCQEYKSPQHVYPNMGFDIEVSCSDPNGDPISVTATVRRGNLSFVSKTGTTYRYHYTAPPTFGDDTVTVVATDSKGAQSVPLVINFDNPVDER